MHQPDQLISTYEGIAGEYYNPDRHPTCSNFSELSNRFLDPRIRKIVTAESTVLELGAGRSSVAPISLARGFPLASLILLDQSARMLEHSRKWARQGVRLVIGDAWSTGLPAASFQLIVSSLGDPYNGYPLWREVARLLDREGICLFTTRAPEGAERFRAPSETTVAEFILADGSTVRVRSDIPPLERQKEVISAAGLQIEEIESLTAVDLTGPGRPSLWWTIIRGLLRCPR